MANYTVNNLSLTLQGHLRSKVMAPNERSSYKFLYVYNSNHVHILHHSHDGTQLAKLANFVSLANCQNSRWPLSVYTLMGPDPSYNLIPSALKLVEICGRSSVFHVFDPNLDGAKVVIGGTTRSKTFTSPIPGTIVT